MLRNILTPLRSSFSLTTPRTGATDTTAHDNDYDTPEDFARDAMIDLMRINVEHLHGQTESTQRIQTLGEILKVLAEESATKDVFREMDGFLTLMSIFTSLDRDDPNTINLNRLCFNVLNEALKNHRPNKLYFRVSIGWDTLAEAIKPCAQTPHLTRHFVASLLAFTISDFSAYDPLYEFLEVDVFTPNEPPGFHDIINGESFGAVFRILDSDSALLEPVLKLTENLIMKNHWNAVQVYDQGLVAVFLGWLHKHECLDGTEETLFRLLKRLLEVGTNVNDLTSLLHMTSSDGDAMDNKYLALLRQVVRPKWPCHFAFRKPASLVFSQEGIPVSTPSELTFLAWILVDAIPSEHPLAIFTIYTSVTPVFKLSLRSDKRLQIEFANTPAQTILLQAPVAPNEWTHIGMSIGVSSKTQTLSFWVNGNLATSTECQRVKLWEASSTYVFGDSSRANTSRWCLATASLLSKSLGTYIFTPLNTSASLASYSTDNELIRFIHHLGPRYQSMFQTRNPVRLLTYEASTSLGLYLASLKNPARMKDIFKNGFGISENEILLLVTPSSTTESGTVEKVINLATKYSFIGDGEYKGDVIFVNSQNVDDVFWEIGGPSIALRLVEISQSPDELSNAVGILFQSMQDNWRNSDEMESIRGFEILSGLLRKKSDHIDISTFRSIFGFLGCNFKHPEQSTIQNSLAYLTLALDFGIWSHTKLEVQRAHLEQFSIFLSKSKNARYNAKHKLARLGVVRKMLFVLQTSWYHENMLSAFVQALTSCLESSFTPEDAIKPVVAYLAANLHSGNTPSHSPQSFVSRLQPTEPQEKATLLLIAFVSLLHPANHLKRFMATLPFSRTCLLLLGERPTPAIATQVLLLLKDALISSTSYIRKFELVNGWLVLRFVLPQAWSPSVHAAAFDILLGPKHIPSSDSKLVCAQIFPAILASFLHQFDILLSCAVLQDGSSNEDSIVAYQTFEFFVGELSATHTANAAFRALFKSQQLTASFANAYRSFITKLAEAPAPNELLVCCLEKLNNFALLLALDGMVEGSQKQSLLNTLKKAQKLIGSAESDSASPDTNGSYIAKTNAAAGAGLDVVGERTFSKSLKRVEEWRTNIITSEKKRYARHVQDLRERHRTMLTLGEWRQGVLLPPGPWGGRGSQQVSWRLDLTEGPFRVRKRLEPDFLESSAFDLVPSPSKEITEIDGESDSIVNVEIPPWADDSRMLNGTDEDSKWVDDVNEDKHRRVRHALELGDVIEAVQNVTRIVGVDVSPALLILGRSFLYIFEGFMEKADGELIDARDAPPDLLTSMQVPKVLPPNHKPQRWNYAQCFSLSKRTCLFRDVALEIYFEDCQNLLIVFPTRDDRHTLHKKLEEKAQLKGSSRRTSLIQRTPLLGKMSAKLAAGLGFADELQTAQRRWQSREISNFTYLSILNQASGRTPSDATQYPVFPWVLRDYTSRTINLDDEACFRDLSLPMGALTPARREIAELRYSNLASVNEDPFHYGTHFSSAMIVCHFLIRLEPFTHMFKTLQGGDWDLPDRLFSDIARSFHSASEDTRGDVRELIGEFYTCPEFLENASNLDFGVQQSTGQRIHHVILPPWARDDPLLFIYLHRQALESDFVSRNLHKWIDLIWGSKQRDKDALNCFHPLSYEGSIDLDKITDELERKATVGIIHNFGQTPRKLFDLPHPARNMEGSNTTLSIRMSFGIEEDAHLLMQSSKPVRTISSSVESLTIDMIGETVIPSPHKMVHVPNYPHEYVTWKGPDKALRYYADNKLVDIVDQAICSCAVFADSSTMATAAEDGTVRIWRILRTGQQVSLTCRFLMRGHATRVNCISSCKAWSMVVTGGDDGSVCFWDLNKGRFLKSIQLGEGRSDPIIAVSIMESTGYVAACSAFSLNLYTMNGRLITRADIPRTDPIHCLAFHERDYSRRGVLACGGNNGVTTLRTWAPKEDKDADPTSGSFQFVPLRTLQAREKTFGKIGAVRFVGEAVYVGDEQGFVYSWDLPD